MFVSQDRTTRLTTDLAAWFRVPSKVWLGLPDSNDIVKCTSLLILLLFITDRQALTCMHRIANALLSMNEVLLDGMTQLDKGTLREVATHVMDKSNWAKQIRAKVVFLSAPPTYTPADIPHPDVPHDAHLTRPL